jgi:hypothetical protein
MDTQNDIRLFISSTCSFREKIVFNFELNKNKDIFRHAKIHKNFLPYLGSCYKGTQNRKKFNIGVSVKFSKQLLPCNLNYNSPRTREKKSIGHT